MAKKKTATSGYKKILCTKCTGLCCRYFALPIDTPEDWGDYDDIRWYLAHEDVTVFVEDGDWYLNVINKCRYLSEKDYKCGNYDLRPRICRGYETETCDHISDDYDYDYEMNFTSDTQMEEYMKIKFGPKVFDKLEKKKKTRKKKKAKK